MVPLAMLDFIILFILFLLIVPTISIKFRKFTILALFLACFAGGAIAYLTLDELPFLDLVIIYFDQEHIQFLQSKLFFIAVIFAFFLTIFILLYNIILELPLQEHITESVLYGFWRCFLIVGLFAMVCLNSPLFLETNLYQDSVLLKLFAFVPKLIM
jgi:hypothetical protein